MTTEEAIQLHESNGHALRGFGDDWMECRTPRCSKNRRDMGIDPKVCPTCGQYLNYNVRVVHKPAPTPDETANGEATQ